MDLEVIKNKQKRFMDLCDELEQIQSVLTQLDNMDKSIVETGQSYAFGIFWYGHGGGRTQFAFNGALNKYTDMTKNVTALMRIELEKRKNELETEINQDFGGAD